jgi:hypothetical protein
LLFIFCSPCVKLLRFDYLSLDDAHVMAIARGPPYDALPAYQTLAWGATQESKLASLRLLFDLSTSTLSLESESSTQSHLGILNQSSLAEPSLLHLDSIFAELNSSQQSVGVAVGDT